MKKILSLVLVLCLMLAVFACGNGEQTTTENPDGTTESTQSTTEPSGHKHIWKTDEVIKKATAFEKGQAKATCTECGEQATIDTPTSIKILAIGNSFSVDALQYLNFLFEEAGVEEVLIGNLYIGGCSLDTHYQNAVNNSKSYDYYRNGSVQSGKRSIGDTLMSQDWDFVTVQQVSQDSGMPGSYGNLDGLLDFVRSNVEDDCKIYWHSTWAYQKDSTHSGFANYGNDQMAMYNAIIKTVKDEILTNDKISGVIPSGTAVQNLRTSYVGDTITRDGYHMSYSHGRYLTALTWFGFFGGDIDSVTWYPAGYPETSDDMAIIKEAAKNALNAPYEITTSAYPPEEIDPGTVDPAKLQELTDEDKALLTEKGFKPEEYKSLILNEFVKGYYNSTDKSRPYTIIFDANNSKNFITTDVYSKGEIPTGSVIYVKDGFQYRPEGWVTEGQVNASAARPGNVTEEIVVVDDSWWGDFNYRAFNIAYKGNQEVVSDSNIGVFKVFIPIVENPTIPDKEPEPIVPVDPAKLEALTDADKAILTAKGYDTTKYKALKLEEIVKGYFNSTDKTRPYTVISDANNSPNFIVTTTFEKADIPNGSIIHIASGYQYRPEGWVTEGQINASSARPANVSTEYVVVDSAWWGDFTIRAFNVSLRISNAAVSDEDVGALRIYIPVA